MSAGPGGGGALPPQVFSPKLNSEQEARKTFLMYASSTASATEGWGGKEVAMCHLFFRVQLQAFMFMFYIYHVGREESKWSHFRFTTTLFLPGTWGQPWQGRPGQSRRRSLGRPQIDSLLLRGRFSPSFLLQSARPTGYHITKCRRALANL